MSDVKIEQRELSDGQRAYYAWLNTHFLSDNQIERIKAEFEYLQTENEKLRERVAEMEELTDEKRYIPQEWYQLATAENKKLRELVAEIWPTAEYAGYEHELSRARELMRELGYEED